MLNITNSIENGKALVVPEGRLDTVTAPDFEKSVKEIIGEANELTLDFGKLEYISSAGLRVLLSIQKSMIDKGDMKIINTNEIVREVFDITGFSDILTIE